MRAGKQQQEEERTNENWQVDKRTKGLCLTLKTANYRNSFPCSYPRDGCKKEDLYTHNWFLQVLIITAHKHRGCGRRVEKISLDVQRAGDVRLCVFLLHPSSGC